VIGTDANGCMNSAEQFIQVNPLPIVEIEIINGNDSICAGESAILVANGATTFEWNTTEIGPEIEVTETGNYQVIGTDANGCMESATFDLTVHPLPIATIEIIAGSSEICMGESTTLLASGGDDFQWNEGQTTAEITVETTNNYTVTITDDNGCGDTYQWNNSATTAEIPVITSGDYEVVATDSNGCTNTALQAITVHSLPLATIEITAGDSILCDGETAVLTAFGGELYKWNTNENTATIEIGITGDYEVSVIDSNGCQNQSSLFIEVVDLPEIPLVFAYNLGGDTYLAIEQPNLQNGFSYEWFLNGELLSGENEFEIFCPENGTYQVQITDGNGCQSISEEFTTVGCVTNTIQVDFVEKLDLFPNPSQNEININIEFSKVVNLEKLSIYDATGKLVLSEKITQSTVNFQKKLNVQDLANGIYWLELMMDGKPQVLRFVKG